MCRQLYARICSNYCPLFARDWLIIARSKIRTKPLQQLTANNNNNPYALHMDASITGGRSRKLCMEVCLVSHRLG